jgi:hypothetical protein
VLENRMLRRIFGSRRKNAIQGRTKLHSEELHDLYSLPGIVMMIKSRRTRRVGNNWERRNIHARFWLDNFKERGCLEDLSIEYKEKEYERL